MAGPEKVTFTVGDEDTGRRLDQVLAARVPGLSRRQARVLLDIGGVFVDGRRIKVAGRPARAGEKIVAVLGGALARATGKPGRAARTEDERKLPPYAVVFEDEDVVVVDKPAGLLAAPTPESDRNNLVSLLERREEGGPRILVVHRIDLETSGLIVFAKSPRRQPRPLRAVPDARPRARLPGRGRRRLSGRARPHRQARGGPASSHARRCPRAARRAGHAARLPPRDGPHAPDPAARAVGGASGHRRRSLRRAVSRGAGAADGAARDHARLRPPAHGRAALLHQPLAAGFAAWLDRVRALPNLPR